MQRRNFNRGGRRDRESETPKIVDEFKNLLGSKQTLSEAFKEKQMIKKILGFNGLVHRLTASMVKAKEIKISQIRKLFEPIKKLESKAKMESVKKSRDEEIDEKDYLELNKWLTLVTYNVGRRYIPRAFLDLVIFLTERVKTYQDVIHLSDIFHTLIAYHTYESKGG